MTWKEEVKQIEFTKHEVMKYLDKCIDFWRNSEGPDSKYYVDAFQSVRISLFGKTKPSGHGGIGGGR